MRGRLALIAAGAAAAVAVAHKLRSRRRASGPVAVEPPEPGPDPRAEELRDKLAASREVVDEREIAEERELPVDEAVAVEDDDADVEARREEVHARGRAAVADMQTEVEPAREP